MPHPLLRTAAIATAVTLGTGPGLSGQGAPAPDSLLDRLTAEAITSSPAVLRRDALARAALTRVRPAGALPDPMLSVGVMDLTLPRFGFRESDFTEVDIELVQQFPWPGTLGAETRAAQAMARGTSAEASTLRREVAVRVAMLYYRLRYVITAEQILAKQWTLVENAVEIATTRYGTGSVPQTDPLQARIALARLVTEQASLRVEDSGLRADLRAARGIRRSEQLLVAPISPDSVAAILEDAARGHAIQLALADPLATHPRLEAHRAEIDAATATARAEALTGRPDFEITTRYGYRPLGSDFFSAFVGIRVPLWAGRKQRLLAQAARIDAEAAQRGLEEVQASIAAELEQALADARGGAVRLRLLVSSVLPLTREGVGAALRGYRTGQSDFLNVFTALDTHYRAELEATEVAAEHLTHLVILEQLLEPESAP